MTVGSRTRIAALVGDPVEHSFSPIIHNTAYRILGLDAVYLTTRVYRADLRDALSGMKALGFMGANVTIPHKQDVTSIVDTMSGDAAAIGAVNTIVFQSIDGGRRLVGDNTDVTGFLAPLQVHRSSLTGGRCLILGAGGAARAVFYAVLTAFRPAHVAFATRRPDRGRDLADAFAGQAADAEIRVLSFADAGTAVADADLVINATPVGMYPQVTTTPLPDTHGFRRGQIVYDLIYNPVQTRLLQEASTRGATTINGIEMLISQAAAAHVLWTGTHMPVAEVRNELLKAVG